MKVFEKRQKIKILLEYSMQAAKSTIRNFDSIMNCSATSKIFQNHKEYRMRTKYYLAVFMLSIMLFGCKSSIVDDPVFHINYSVPEKALVKLTIENSYNTIIKTPVDRELDAGDYVIYIDINDLAEGVYFYTLELKGVTSNYYSKTTKHLLVVK